MKHCREICAEGVVVSELQLLERYCVVFVHDRDGALLQKELECVECVRVAPPVNEVSAREKKLCADISAVEQEFRILFHQKSLTCGGACLLCRDRCRARAVSEAAESGGDRAGGNKHNAVPRIAQIGDLPDDVSDLFGGHASVRSRER